MLSGIGVGGSQTPDSEEQGNQRSPMVHSRRAGDIGDSAEQVFDRTLRLIWVVMVWFYFRLSSASTRVYCFSKRELAKNKNRKQFGELGAEPEVDWSDPISHTAT